MSVPLIHILISVFFLIMTITMRWGLAKGFVLLCYKHIPKLRNEKFDDAVVRRFIGETSKKLGVVLLMIAVIIILDPTSTVDVLKAGWFAFAFVLVGSMTFFGKFNIVEWFKTR